MEHGTKEQKELRQGVICAFTAFLMWGILPLYFKALKAVPTFEIITHRTVWSFFFTLGLVIFLRKQDEVAETLTHPRRILILLSSATIFLCNTFIVVWAINHNYVLQVSLGHFITPLTYILVGMLILKEKLRPHQGAAVALAAIGVFYLTVTYGEFPWVAICLAFSSTFYTLIRKVAPVSALSGLFIELLLSFLPALAYLIYLDFTGLGHFFRSGIDIHLFLIGIPLFTALPLLLFTMGARQLPLSSVGFLQYILPTCYFFLAVFLFREPLVLPQLWTFILIWIALAVYSTESLFFYRNARLAPDNP